MDAAEILVAVLTAAAVGWLVWVEIRCRRSQANQTADGTSEEVDCVTACRKEVPNGDHKRPVRGRRKGRDLTTRQET